MGDAQPTNSESCACMCHRSKILWLLRPGGRDSEVLEPHSTTRKLWFAYQDVHSQCKQQVRSRLDLQMFPEGIILLRTRIHAMFLHLHNAGFLQGSVYPRNILIQPGPLTVPPSKRSMASPSFRIIDFGRADYKRDFLRDAIGVTALERHEKWLEDYDDFITTVGAAEAEKEYTITIYDNKDGECEDKRDKETAKSREVRMVMGLEEDKWTRLCKARRYWAKMVREADQEVCETLWR